MFNIINSMILAIRKHKKLFDYVFYSIISSGINVLVYLICYNFIFANIIFSNSIAYIFSITISFLLNKKVVFKNDSNRIFRQMFAYLVVKTIALFIDTAVLHVLKDMLHMSNFWAKIIANCSTTISNYSLNNLWVFKKETK